jgi:hypothetical protein
VKNGDLMGFKWEDPLEIEVSTGKSSINESCSIATFDLRRVQNALETTLGLSPSTLK